MTAINETLLRLQQSRNERARVLMAESNAALAKADEAKARLTVAHQFKASENYPRLHANLLSEWEHWTTEARRLHDEAWSAATGR